MYSVAENTKNVCDTYESNMPYERVFQQTTSSDGQVMEIYDKAQYLYDLSNNEIFRAVKKAKRKRKKTSNHNQIHAFNDNISKSSDVKALL